MSNFNEKWDVLIGNILFSKYDSLLLENLKGHNFATDQKR